MVRVVRATLKELEEAVTALRDGELVELKAEVQGKLPEVLRSLVIDTANDHNTQDTAKRVAKMFVEAVFRGR